ncbi:catechol 2,3-dioxygenase-like lactoylglutathione lyase family enzyme [Novosphingobium chloroacetimidivorans]|uniref:Bleomycin resistance protein n=1 Tax=Novosphingobium chloroacetimidivorans TaxID=1428314 RepID=A0A7W7K8H3_9SPHN|nr:glyoxalase superfamily protein [Novosphingobium chloroacetimidivorans]MBB4858190.1 catechol 2,3-dioxygenase-like lactoylglutathione lyase family enzyme [Novosphingobium chloroacetimidivorans]
MSCGCPTPILRSFDEARSKAFYCDFLGFTLTFEHRFEADLPLYMGVELGSCRLHLSEHYGDATPGSAVRIPVMDVVGYARGLRAKNFGCARPGRPKQAPWGSLEFTVTDPAGNRLTFYSEAPPP